VGLSVFATPSPDAVRANDRGVSLLAKGKPEDAASELEAALRMAPSFVLARYNLTCALARAGRHADARAALEAVWEEDFVGTRAHAETDADLADFWKSEPGRALAARVPALEARYQEVLDRGLHAILWRDGPRRPQPVPSLLRVGVFDAASKRFVAVAPSSPKAFYGFAPQLAPHAVVATGAVREMLGGDLDAGKRLESVRFYAFSTKGVPVATLDVGLEPYFGALTAGTKGAQLAVWQTAGPVDGKDKYGALFELAWGAAPTKRWYSDAHGPGPSPDRPVTMGIGYNHWGYPTTELDARYAYGPHELRLPGGAKVPIPKALAFYQAPPRSIVASPAGDRVVLVWNGSTFVCDGTRDIPGRYKMALVDVAHGTVTSLGEGDGAGHAAFTKAGDLYVQRGTRLFRVAPGGDEPQPEGVLLVPPLERNDECGF
jgi:hypothetical protein